MIFSIYVLAFLVTLTLLDQNFVQYIFLQVELLALELRKIPLRIRLEWDIYRIKHDRDRYLKMAKEVLKDLDKDV